MLELHCSGISTPESYALCNNNNMKIRSDNKMHCQFPSNYIHKIPFKIDRYHYGDFDSTWLYNSNRSFLNTQRAVKRWLFKVNSKMSRRSLVTEYSTSFLILFDEATIVLAKRSLIKTWKKNDFENPHFYFSPTIITHSTRFIALFNKPSSYILL